jgi:hypothetical protein
MGAFLKFRLGVFNVKVYGRAKSLFRFVSLTVVTNKTSISPFDSYLKIQHLHNDKLCMYETATVLQFDIFPKNYKQLIIVGHGITYI